MPDDFIPKAQYDRVVELLYSIVRNEVYMSTSKKVIGYLIDLGFTDEELVNLVNFSKDEIIDVRNAKSNADDTDDDDVP